MQLRSLRTITISAVAALALLPATALADFQTLYDDYRADSVIDGCTYSSGVLTGALGDIPADIREYDPGFTDAINAALEQAAAGCGAAPAEAVPENEEVIAADGSPGPASPRPLAIQVSGGEDRLPAVLLALMIACGAALAAGAVLATAHYFGWDLRRRLAPVGAAERRLVDRLRSMRDRLGF